MRNNVIILASIACGTMIAGEPSRPKKFYADDPVWTMPQPAAVRNAHNRQLSEYYDFFENTLFEPGDRAPRKGMSLPSLGINTVDEVPDSAWYTNRHASRRLTAGELKRGAGDSNAPAPGTWSVVAAKNEGVTPGFRIRDAAGRQYLVKFDPLSNPEMASAADAITSKFFHALGYNVPENYVVYFDRSRIAVAEGAQLKDGSGRKRPIRESDVEDMLRKAPRTPDGRYRALASYLIPGKPMGPFRYDGTRSDDPNDLVPHEDRRDLRALRTFCAWLGHDDSKALNTLDVLVEENGTPSIRHYLIDFGASLGSASFEANSPREGNARLFAWKSSAVNVFSLGLYAPKWQHAKYPNLPSAGRFEYEIFDPRQWVSNYPNAAFRNENPADRAWAARKINAFTDDDIRAIVSTGLYSDPASEEWVARCLIERRNKIVRAFLTGLAGLDGFAVQEDRLVFHDSGPAPADAAALRIQWAVFDNRTGRRQRLPGASSFDLPRVENGEYVVAEIGGEGGPAAAVYVSLKQPAPRVVGVERLFAGTQWD